MLSLPPPPHTQTQTIQPSTVSSSKAAPKLSNPFSGRSPSAWGLPTRSPSAPSPSEPSHPDPNRGGLRVCPNGRRAPASLGWSGVPGLSGWWPRGRWLAAGRRRERPRGKACACECAKRAARSARETARKSAERRSRGCGRGSGHPPGRAQGGKSAVGVVVEGSGLCPESVCQSAASCGRRPSGAALVV